MHGLVAADDLAIDFAKRPGEVAGVDLLFLLLSLPLFLAGPRTAERFQVGLPVPDRLDLQIPFLSQIDVGGVDTLAGRVCQQLDLGSIQFCVIDFDNNPFISFMVPVQHLDARPDRVGGHRFQEDVHDAGVEVRAVQVSTRFDETASDLPPGANAGSSKSAPSSATWRTADSSG